MILGAVRCFDDALLLLEFFFDAPSFSHASGKRHRRDCEHGYPQLQRDQRLIFRFPNERPEAMQRSPNRDHGQYENARSSFEWSEAKGRPNHDWATNKGDGIIPGGNLKPP